MLVANVYRQDLPVPGFTSQLTYVRNTNHEGGEFHYDTNGFLVTPAPIGDCRGYNYDVNYFGYNGDGHFGRINLTASAYWALGNRTTTSSAGCRTAGRHLGLLLRRRAVDRFRLDRVRLSGLFASGDNNPQGGRATGFDAIFENPQFAGADSATGFARAFRSSAAAASG